MKICVFVRSDFINGVAYSPGEIAGWRDEVADRLIARGFAKLHGDGRPKVIDGKIPGAEDWWSNKQLAEHLAKLEKAGGWTPPPPIALKDEAVAREARERAAREFNQL